jgi:MOSC domain-containing protein YiiM
VPRVIALQLHEQRGVVPRPVDEADAIVGGGLMGDSHAAKEKRAVLVVDRATLGAHGLGPGDLREQITTEGLPNVTELAPGTLLRVGGLTLRVNSECAPCTHIGGMLGVDDVEAFRASLRGRRGALCTVVSASGPVRIGDDVEVMVVAPA